MKKQLTKDLTLFYADNFPNNARVKDISKYIVLGIGGNVGDVKKRFDMLYMMLKQNTQIKLIATSPILQNPPFGYVDQDDFYNAVVVIDTHLSPNELLKYTQRLERRFHRKNEFKNAPRTIDIDIITYKNKTVKSKNLTLPHPEYKKRESVMIPLGLVCKRQAPMKYGFHSRNDEFIRFSSIQAQMNLGFQKLPSTIYHLPSKPKVLVGLSGGVDSSMSAMMLQKMGYEVEGVYMKLHSVSEDYHRQNLEAVAKVANFLGIKYHILDIEDTFKKQVYDYFIQSYRDGITPNPCVVCNRLIKFGAMVDFAKSLGMDKVATGHYAKTDGKFIYCADDQSKDQSYFLAQVDKSVIPMLIFPMSNYKKEEIISMASKMPSFKTIAQKKESQEICFVPTVYTDILSQYYNTDIEGDVIKEGKVVGKHKGYMHYTIGKRRGFSVHGAHDPHFVLSTNPKDNTITVGIKEQLAVNSVVLGSLNMFIEDLEFDAVVKLRYRSSGVPCHVVIKDSKAEVTLKEPVYGVAMGQYGVFYMGDKVVGSGEILTTNN